MDKLTIHERLLFFQANLKKKLKKKSGKLNFKISILVVPSSGDEIRKIHFPFISGFFILILLSGILGINLYFLVKKFQVQEQEREEEIYYKYKVTAFLHYLHIAGELSKTIQSLTENSEELNQIAWGRKSGMEGIDASVQELSKKNTDFSAQNEVNNIYSQSVLQYIVLRSSLDELKPLFQNAMEYLDTRESIYQSLPSGRPLSLGIGKITSTFGERTDPFGFGTGDFHNGIDFAAGEKTPIYATAPGVVADSEQSEGGLGKSVRINHENGFYSVYGHCSAVVVKKGDIVNRGDLIALVGSTGKATGPHIHYEVHIGLDPPIDPKEFINME